MKFGIPNQRPKRKPELYPDTPVLTIGIDGGKGTSRAMILNSKAVETLGLGDEDATVLFGFEEGRVFITNGNQDDVPEEHRIRVTKGNPRKISEKRTYTYISEKVFNLDNSVENHLVLTATVQDGVSVYELLPMTNASTDTKSVVFEIDEKVEAKDFVETAN